jgi:fermentation-respiration switch protein FrsA (DUF1100 family)
MTRLILVILLLVVLTYIGVAIYLYRSQNRYIYFPTRDIESTPADRGLAYQQVTFSASDGVGLHGWFIPAERQRGVVLYCHGNGGNIGHCVESAAILHDLGFSVLAYDYRGYGRSDGTPSEEGTYRDAEAAWRYLVDERGVAASDIVMVGRSLGGAVATWLATQHPPRALILESTFTSMPEMASRTFPLFPASLIVTTHYNTLERIGSIHCPVLVVHSRADEVIPYELGEELYRRANSPKEFLEIGGTHNSGYLTTGRSYIEGLDRFLTRYIPGAVHVREP